MMRTLGNSRTMRIVLPLLGGILGVIGICAVGYGMWAWGES